MHPVATCQGAEALDLGVSTRKSSQEDHGQLKLSPHKNWFLI